MEPQYLGINPFLIEEIPPFQSVEPETAWPFFLKVGRPSFLLRGLSTAIRQQGCADPDEQMT